MAKAVIMPKQGISVESCIITQWNVKVGDDVKVGDVLFSYETDKAAFEEESAIEGKVLAILREEEDDVPCLENICVIGDEGEDISEYLNSNPSTEGIKEAVETVIEKPEEVISVAPKVEGGRIFISPRAKKLATSSNADLSRAKASGPNNRIIERDVELLIKNNMKTNVSTADVEQAAVKLSQPTVEAIQSAAVYEDVKLSKVRRVIASSMHKSLSEMAQLTLNSSFDATAILNYRKSVKANSEKMGLNNITINDMLLYVTAKTLLKHKEMNAHYLGDTMRLFSGVNMGIAVDTDRGLLVPSLMGADSLSLNDLSQKTKDLISTARGGSISPDLLTGGTFTVTNLGTLGVESFTPVINPPQTGILGVCAITQKVKVVDGNISTYPSMNLSLTFDHRAVDGAPAAMFLGDLCSALENFNLTLSL